MISDSVLRCSIKYRDDFQNAEPFKHVCIDGFFEESAAEKALDDFPPFAKENAKNEFGKYAGKAVINDIAAISSFYKTLYDYLFSTPFLRAMSDLTGIPDLQGDPSLYGGGTHENMDGQELDPHVDFNFQIKEGYHRRVNLLLYLNKEWDPDWGGAIEMHSNPRHPESNKIKDFNVIFNRAVIFETNEYSWHGFRKIELPSDKKNLSRKCISVYLYTKDRPKSEIAGPHGTFYVQRPLGFELVNGMTLTQRQIEQIRTGFARRDQQIEMYQLMEERHGREIESLRTYISDILSAVRIPLIGWARQEGATVGIYHDGWASPTVSFDFAPLKLATSILFNGSVPDTFPIEERKFEIRVNGQIANEVLNGNGQFQWRFLGSFEPGKKIEVQIKCNKSFKASESGGDDMRPLSYLLSAVTVE